MNKIYFRFFKDESYSDKKLVEVMRFIWYLGRYKVPVNIIDFPEVILLEIPEEYDEEAYECFDKLWDDFDE